MPSASATPSSRRGSGSATPTRPRRAHSWDPTRTASSSSPTTRRWWITSRRRRSARPSTSAGRHTRSTRTSWTWASSRSRSTSTSSPTRRSRWTSSTGSSPSATSAAWGADHLGYEGFFLPETWAHDTTALLAEAAVRTRRIRLGSGILGVWGRSAATIAMAASTLHDISGGRFTLGLGASTAQLAEGLHDVPFSAPTERMRRVITQVRALLKGERIPLAAATGARPLRLNLPPAPAVPIFLAGLAADSIRLAGELADGWIPFLYPRSRLAEGKALLKEGAARTGAPRELPLVCPSMPAVGAAAPRQATAGAAWFVSVFLTGMRPLYPRTLSHPGLEEEVRAVVAANTTRGSATIPPEAEVLLEELTVYGTPGEARARLARWQAAGAALPILLLPPNLEPKQIDFALEAFR